MEQILAFVLGVGAVAFIWAVVTVFKTASKLKEIEREITEQQVWIIRNDTGVNRRIDEEIDRVNNIYQDCISFTDSRVDKLEAKITGNLTSKENLKG